MQDTVPLPGSQKAINVDVLSWTQAFTEYNGQVAGLVEQKHLNPTLLPGWLDVTIRAHDLVDHVFVVTVFEKEQLVAFVPLIRNRSRHMGMWLTTIEPVSNVVSYHAELVCTSGFEQCLELLLRKMGNWDIFRFANLVDNAQSLHRLLEFTASNRMNSIVLPSESSPVLPIRSDWDKYIAEKNKKFRYKVRQRQNSLSGSSELRAMSIRSAQNLDRIVEEIFAVEANSWKAKFGLDIPTHGQEKSYYALLIPYLAEIDALHIDMLYFEERPVAYSLCANWNGWFGQLKTSFDEGYAHLSPGAMVIDLSIKAAFDTGATEFDFLGDMDNHKRAWTQRVRRHCDVFIYNQSTRAQLLYFARRAKARLSPHVRKAATKPDDLTSG